MQDIVFVTFPMFRSDLKELRSKTGATNHTNAINAAIEYYLKNH
jgi:hypothetical protein